MKPPLWELQFLACAAEIDPLNSPLFSPFYLFGCDKIAYKLLIYMTKTQK